MQEKLIKKLLNALPIKIDKNSHILEHCHEIQHSQVWKTYFKILNDNYRNNIKREIGEVLHMQTIKPTLNAKEKSIKLNLYN